MADMRGHMSNRSVLAYLKTMYQLAKDKRDRHKGALSREFFEGQMQSIVDLAFGLDLIKDRLELEPIQNAEQTGQRTNQKE